MHKIVGKIAVLANVLFLVMIALLAGSCQESLEERAERDAKEFTRKYCPTPVQNFTRTDSVGFVRATRTYTYYMSFVDNMDNEELINEHKQEIHDMLGQALKESTNMKTYIEAGFKFEYVCRSGSDPKKVLVKFKY